MGKQRNRGQRQPSNFQDNAEVKEYDKGFDAGKSSNRGRNNNRNRSKTPLSPISGVSSSDNDPNWYIPDEQLAKDIASIQWGIATGGATQFKPQVKSTIDYKLQNNYQPGIMAFEIIPTFGDSSSESDPINIAANVVYTSAKMAQTSTFQGIEAPDVMITLLAVDQCYMFYTFLCRAYGILSNFSMLDRYTPQILCRAMHLDYNSLSNNMSDFRALINQWGFELAAYIIPTGINLLERHKFLFENVYTDSDTAKAQYYLYTPAGFYIYSEAQVNVDPYEGSYLKYYPLYGGGNLNGEDGDGLLTLENIQTQIQEMMNPLRASEDIRNITSFLLKIFGTGSLYRVNPISENYYVKPVYNKEVLAQMENAYIYPAATKYDFTLTQQTGIDQSYLVANYLLYNCGRNQLIDSTYTGNLSSDPWQWIQSSRIWLNRHDDATDYKNVLEMTRLSGAGIQALVQESSEAGNLTYYHSPITVGSEICSQAVIYMLDYYNLRNGDPLYTLNINTQQFMQIALVSATMNMPAELTRQMQQWNPVVQLSRFDWHPEVSPVFYGSLSSLKPTGGINIVVGVMDRLYDLDNFTWIEVDQLKEINRVAILGELVIKGLSSSPRR